jgi:hypothetical protein
VQREPVASDFGLASDYASLHNGQVIKKTVFYVRASNATRELDDAEKAKYILGRWPARSTSPESNH